MDSLLEASLRKIEAQIKKLARVERRYLGLEGARKTTYALLFAKSLKKSIAEREYDVQANPEWMKYMEELVDAEVTYNQEKRVYDLLVMVHHSEKSTFKVDASAIRSGVG